MNKTKIIIISSFICIACIVVVCVLNRNACASRNTSDGTTGQVEESGTDKGTVYPDEVKQYVDAINFFGSKDWEEWNEMAEISPLFTEEAFTQSLYHLGKIDMNEYDCNQKGVQDISQCVEDAKEACRYLIKSLNGEESYDKYEGSLMLSDAIDNMDAIKVEADRLREKYKEYFEQP